MLHILSNPQSGSGRIRTYALCHQLDAAGVPYQLHTTSEEAALQRTLPAWGLTKHDSVLLVGGDGSLNQLINLLPAADTPALLLLPSGSGNDFARGMGMKRSEKAALSLLTQSPALAPILLDSGEITSINGRPAVRRFAVSCGIGYDAGVCHAIDTGRLKGFLNHFHLGKLAYLLHGVQGIFRYKRASGSLTLDQSRTVTFTNLAFLSCHNLPYEGGGFGFAPGASPRDGELTLCLITARSRLTFALTLLASIPGWHVHLPNVHLYTCREAEVSADTPLPFHTDGEVRTGVTGFTLRAVPQWIPFRFVPGKD